MGINANVSGGQQITASVGETKIDVAVSGGVGPSGASGAAGAAATITVGTVTTGAPGSSASVVNAGTTSAAVLNFTIPAGATGATGPQGATGPAGTTTWGGITDKPSAFNPTSHQHVAADITDFTSAVVAAAPPTTNASLLTSGTLPDARLSANIARTSDVSSAVAAVVNAAPAALDTLNELAAALGNDASFATTVTNAIAGKAAAAHTHTVSAITDAGTAATRNAPASGNASSSEVVLGSDTRLTDARTPTSHAHGFLSSSGDLSTSAGGAAAGTVALVGFGGGPSAGKLVAATSLVGLAVSASSNTLLVSYGTTALTACQGNDARLSDARAPLAHNQAWSTITSTPTTLAGYGITDAASALHTHSAADVTSGTVDPARLGSGTASDTTFLRGDSAYAPVSEVYEFTRSSKPADATGSNGSYSWTIPANARLVEFFAVGAGGGGGSGRRGAAGSARFGGGGGGSGAVMLFTRAVAELSTRSISMVVGAGGVGGAAVTVDDTNGNNAAVATDTQITIGSQTLYASRGAGGSGGTAAAGTGGAGGNGLYSGNAGANSSATANPNGTNLNNVAGFAAAGGGAGGGISTGNVSYNGSLARAQGWNAGGFNVNASGGTAPGGSGQNAADAFTTAFAGQPGGSGGGGAAGDASTNGGSGGNGAAYGGAGGGGGAAVNGRNSGAGGNGGDGIVRITVWY